MNINIIAVTIKTVRVAFVSQAAECLPHCQVNPSLDEDHGHLPSEKKQLVIYSVQRDEQNDWHYADNIFKCIYLKVDFSILTQISLQFIPNVQLRISQHWFR